MAHFSLAANATQIDDDDDDDDVPWAKGSANLGIHGNAPSLDNYEVKHLVRISLVNKYKNIPCCWLVGIGHLSGFYPKFHDSVICNIF